MVSKKIKLLLALLGLMQTVSFAQSTDAKWAYDSSKVSSKDLPQYNEFVNYQTPYPPSPRNMWELSIGAGYNSILGADVKAAPGYGFSVGLRKSLGHVISVRGQWNGSFNYGLDGQLSRGRASLLGSRDYDPWLPYTKNPDRTKAIYAANFRNIAHLLNIDVVASLNNWSHHRGNPKWDWYLFTGPTVYSADVDVDAKDASGNLYDFPSSDNTAFWGRNYKDVSKDLKKGGGGFAGLDGKYESNGGYSVEEQATDYRNNILKDKNGNPNQLIRIGYSVGFGFAFKVTDKINVGVEERITVAFNDELDGNPTGQSRESFNATHLKLNINLGNAAKKVQPLWWVNPNNYLYNEINAPAHLKVSAPPCVDADEDGVCDFLDKEPNTPAGCKVDTHGVTLDTDGDGVPDCKDKEVLTQQSCFPVNADGVGHCPDPACCGKISTVVAASCNISSLPTIQFVAGSSKLSSTAQSLLNSVAQQLNANPLCKVKIVTYGKEGKTNEVGAARGLAIQKYLTEQLGVSESRILINELKPTSASNTTVDLVPYQ